MIRDQLDAIVRQRAAQDPQLFYVDGLALFGADDAADHPLPDGLHPDLASHRLMGERFADLLLAAGALS